MAKCSTPGCKKERAPGRTICYCCKTERYKQLHPIRYQFKVNKANAKRRGIVWGLTFQDFEKLCVRTQYINGKGRTRTGLQVDRIDERKGYFRNNIQVLPAHENLQKYLRFSHDGDGTKRFRYQKVKQEVQATGTDNDYPF